MLSKIDSAISAVATARANYGSIQSRFEVAIQNLTVTAENLHRGRIADFEMRTLLRKHLCSRRTRSSPNPVSQFWPRPSVATASVKRCCEGIRRQPTGSPSAGRATHGLIREGNMVHDVSNYKDLPQPLFKRRRMGLNIRLKRRSRPRLQNLSRQP